MRERRRCRRTCKKRRLSILVSGYCGLMVKHDSQSDTVNLSNKEEAGIAGSSRDGWSHVTPEATSTLSPRYCGGRLPEALTENHSTSSRVILSHSQLFTIPFLRITRNPLPKSLNQSLARSATQPWNGTSYFMVSEISSTILSEPSITWGILRAPKSRSSSCNDGLSRVVLRLWGG